MSHYDILHLDGLDTHHTDAVVLMLQHTPTFKRIHWLLNLMSEITHLYFVANLKMILMGQVADGEGRDP